MSYLLYTGTTPTAFTVGSPARSARSRSAAPRLSLTSASPAALLQSSRRRTASWTTDAVSIERPTPPHSANTPSRAPRIAPKATATPAGMPITQ